MTIITMDMSSYEYNSGDVAEHEAHEHESEWSPVLGLQTVAMNRLEAGRIPASLIGEDVEHFLARMYTC